MHIQTLDGSPRHHRGGQLSYLLLTKGQFGSQNLAVTWVEGEPGSQQALHAHPSQPEDRQGPGPHDPPVVLMRADEVIHP